MGSLMRHLVGIYLFLMLVIVWKNAADAAVPIYRN